MAISSFALYINGIQFSTNASGGTYSVTSTGLTLSSGETWTYTGNNIFLGFSITDGGEAYSGLAVGDSGSCALTFGNAKDDYYQQTNDGLPLYLYSVEDIPASVTVTYGNTAVGSLTQLGQKMRIPSTTLNQDGFVYYLDDIKIECNPASGNQVRCSYWDPYQSDYTDIFATEDAVTQVLDTADQLMMGPVMITYEEVPAQPDLTGTTWLFYNDYTDMTGPWDAATYNINFISNNTNYTSLELDMWTIYYDNTMAFAPGPPQWYNQNYRTISITGGSDVYNSSLRSWLTANATQTEGVVSFTIDGVTYWTPENTTWQTWYDSYLDTGDFSLYPASSKIPERIAKGSWEPGECVMYNDTVVGKTETIVAGRAYVKGNALSGPIISIK